MRKSAFACAKTKTQISCAVNAQLISAFVFVTQIVNYPRFKHSSVTVQADLSQTWTQIFFFFFFFFVNAVAHIV